MATLLLKMPCWLFTSIGMTGTCVTITVWSWYRAPEAAADPGALFIDNWN